MRGLGSVAAAVIATALLIGCGETEAPADNSVEAREQNTVELGGVRYQVVSFRELNVNTEPDDALWEGPPPREGRGLYAVVVRACAAGDRTVTTTSPLALEDAFGERFRPRRAQTSDTFESRPVELAPAECSPQPNSAADRTWDGRVLVFDVPFGSTAERPMVLDIAGGRARVQLDL